MTGMDWVLMIVVAWIGFASVLFLHILIRLNIVIKVMHRQMGEHTRCLTCHGRIREAGDQSFLVWEHVDKIPRGIASVHIATPR